MTDTSQQIVRRPRPFPDTLAQIRYGELNEELAEALNDLVARCSSTGRAGKLVLTLALKPGKSGQIEVVDDLKVTQPKEERGTTLMFATPEGNLTREDPRQLQIEGLRTVDHVTAELRKVGS